MFGLDIIVERRPSTDGIRSQAVITRLFTIDSTSFVEMMLIIDAVKVGLGFFKSINRRCHPQR